MEISRPTGSSEFAKAAVWRGLGLAGTYRLREKNFGIDPFQIAMQMRIHLDDARFWVKHGTYDPPEAGARFHHRMVQIHPFPNGNGRHARIATDTFLQDYFDNAPIEWASGFDLDADNARRAAHIAALRAADAGNFGPIQKFVRSSGASG